MPYVVFYRGSLVAAFVEESDALSYVEHCSLDFELPDYLFVGESRYVEMC